MVGDTYIETKEIVVIGPHCYLLWTKIKYQLLRLTHNENTQINIQIRLLLFCFLW